MISKRETELLALLKTCRTKQELTRKYGVTESSVNADIRRLRRKGYGKLIDAFGLIPDPDSKLKITKKIFVITSAQNDTLIHQGFLKAIYTFCNAHKAQLIVGTVKYRNPTTKTESLRTRPIWPQELQKYYLTEKLALNSNLSVMGGIFIQPTAQDPLSGMENLSGLSSGIYFHNSMRMKVVPNHIKKFPKIVHTTGSISRPEYSLSKAGAKGAFHHVYGALIVEVVDDKIFHIRQIHANVDGDFYDLNKHYLPDSIETVERVDAIVFGDIHAEYIDPETLAACWTNKNSLVNILRPKHQIWHDLIDFNVADSHHNKDNFILKYFMQQQKVSTVTESLTEVVKVINKIIRKDTEHHVVASNHNEHLDQWITFKDFKSLNPKDMALYLKTVLDILSQAKWKNGGYVGSYSVLAIALNYIPGWEKSLNSAITFHDRRDLITINGIDCSNHGDRGAGGVKGLNLKQASQAGVKTISGHSHTPEIYHGAYRVGTSSMLERGYNTGLSSWLSTHCVVYPNGKRALITIINGEFTTLL